MYNHFMVTDMMANPKKTIKPEARGVNVAVARPGTSESSLSVISSAPRYFFLKEVEYVQFSLISF